MKNSALSSQFAKPRKFFLFASNRAGLVNSLLVLLLCGVLAFVQNAMAGDLELSWEPAADNPVPVYEVHYGTQSGSYEALITTATNSVSITGLASGQTYYFAVRACNSDSSFCGEFSPELSAAVSYAEPQAAFSADILTGSAPVAVNFSDRSTGPIDRWEWDFGDGTGATTQHAQHTYEVAGTYSVSLIVSGPGGTDRQTRTNYISVAPPPPIAAFTASPRSGVAPLTVTFSDTSSGRITERTWDFGDGNSSSAAIALYTYTTPGIYSVTLSVVGPGGSGQEQKIELIEVQDPSPPVADFSADIRSGAAPLQVQFQNTSSGEIDSWLWEFGDGSTSTQAQPTHTYMQPGSYQVKLTVAGPQGSDQVTKTDYVQVGENGLQFEVGEITVDQEWQRVTFQQQFTAPIVIAKPMSANDPAPAVVRITDVTTDGFSVVIQEWDYLNGVHAPETLSYLVMERGRHRLANGTWIEAGRLATSATDTFVRTAFSEPFVSPPVMLTAITSYSETDAVATQIRNIDSDGFDIGLREQENNIQEHATESIDYIAWEPSAGVVGDLRFEVGRTEDKVTHRTFTIGFESPFKLPPVFLADIQTTDNQDTANLRWQNKGTETVEVWVDEEQSANWETWHGTEIVGYLALEAIDPLADPDQDSLSTSEETTRYGTDPFSTDTDEDGLDDGEEVLVWGDRWAADLDGDGILNLLDSDSDGDGFSDGVEVDLGFDPGDPNDRPGSSLPFEIGEITLDQEWQWVPFRRKFTDPIVIAKPISSNDPDPAVVRLSNVDTDGFWIAIQEWDYLDGSHESETVSYVAVERGVHQLTGGVWIEAGQLSTGATNTFVRTVFDQSFASAPVVLTSVTTVAEGDAITTQVRKIDPNGFSIRLREQEANQQVHGTETIDYIAWEPSSGEIDGLRFEVGRTKDKVTHRSFTIGFESPFELPPVFLADIQSTDNQDTANLRWKNKSTGAIEIWVDEEQSANWETWHGTEVVGYLLFGR